MDIKFLGLALLNFFFFLGAVVMSIPRALVGVLSFPCRLHHLLLQIVKTVVLSDGFNFLLSPFFFFF